MSLSSQNAFINLLAEDVKNRIVKDVVSADMYSVMADTSGDERDNRQDQRGPIKGDSRLS